MKTTPRLFYALALFGAGAMLRAETFPAKIGQTVEITRSHSWCWYPTIHRFRSGEILVGVVMSPDQINSEGAFSAYCLSRDGGLTWSRRFTMGLGANQDGAWSDVPDGRDEIWQWGSYSDPVHPGDLTHFTATMTKYGHGGRRASLDLDAGYDTAAPVVPAHTWLYEYRFDGKVPVSDTRQEWQIGGRPWGTIIQGPKGEWDCLCYYTSAPDGKRMAAEANSPAPRRFLRDVLLRSTDGGRHWAEHGVIASVPEGGRPTWMGSEGPNEGSLALLADGRLYAIFRTGGRDGMMGEAWSSDGGRTWTAPVSMGFHGVAPRLHRLSTGMLVVVTGRPGPVVLHVNPDGRGEKWLEAATIFEGSSTHYCDVLEVAPGRLLAVYDSLPYGWNPIRMPDRDARNIIYGTFVALGGP